MCFMWVISPFLSFFLSDMAYAFLKMLVLTGENLYQLHIPELPFDYEDNFIHALGKTKFYQSYFHFW